MKSLEELMAINGEYNKMFTAQAQKYNIKNENYHIFRKVYGV